jgi:hypothetical protein
MARADAPVSSRTSASRSLWTFRASPTTKADLDFLSASLHLSASDVVRQLIATRAAQLRAASTAPQVHTQRDCPPACTTCGVTILPGAVPHECLRCSLCGGIIHARRLHDCAAVRGSPW